MVGPTPEELESFNELIQFDHVYFKPAATAPHQQAKKNVSIIKPSVKAHCQKESFSPCTAKKDVVKDTLQIPEEDLATLSQTLEELIDFDSLVECQPAVEPAVTLTSVDSRKRKAETDIAPIVQKKSQSCLPFTDSSGLFPGSEHFGLEASLSPVPSESGYCSDSSDPMAGSPKSDASADLGLDNPWEESFSELFPSLI